MDFDWTQLATPEEEAQAKIAALRGERQAEQAQGLGLLAQLSGDKVLSPVGQTLTSNAQHQMGLLEAMKTRRAQQEIEARRFTESQQEKKREFELRRGDQALTRQVVADARAQRDTAAKEQKDLAQKQKIFGSFADDLDVAKGRANLNAKNESMLRRAEDMETLVKSPGPMTPQKVAEAISMAAFIANGGNAPTVEQLHEMSQKTLGMDYARALQYFTGNPTDARMQGLVEQLRQQSERIKMVGNAQIRRSLLQKLSKHPDALRLYSEDALAHLGNLGITPDMYDPKTFQATYDPVKDAMAEATFTPEQEQAATWARDNMKTDPAKAKAILQKLGLSR